MDAFTGTGQGVQEEPHELTLASSKQLPLQSWVPLGQVPLHAMFVAMQAPTHNFCPLGQAPPHDVPSQVAVPPIGGVHGVQDMLQLFASVELTQSPPQTWYPAWQSAPHDVPSHVAAVAFAVTGHGEQDVPQWSVLRSSTQAPAQE